MDDSEPRPRTTEQRLGSWEEFRQHVAAFENPARARWDEVWFRGQSDARWPLHTSLERRSTNTRAVADYLSLISEIKPAVETFTGGQFSMPNRFEWEKACREYDLFDHKLRECVTYMAHLRHGDFPSPLLDWTPMLRRTSRSTVHGMTVTLLSTPTESVRCISRSEILTKRKSLVSGL
jgi:hypothetical protein